LKFFPQMYDMWINCKTYVYNIELTMRLIKHMKPNENVKIIWTNLFWKTMVELKIYNFAINTMFDALNVELQEIYLACIQMCVEINNNTFKLLCAFIVILNPIKIQFNSIQFGSKSLKIYRCPFLKFI
jgi:hypothetical protein